MKKFFEEETSCVGIVTNSMCQVFETNTSQEEFRICGQSMFQSTSTMRLEPYVEYEIPGLNEDYSLFATKMLSL